MRPIRSFSRSTVIRFSFSMFLFCLLLPSLSIAANITLAWDSNQPLPNGYRIFMRSSNTSYNYSNPVWEGSGTTCTIDQLQAGRTYHFVARAFVSDLESSNSNEVSYSVPLPPADSDGDGLLDVDETDIYGTDPNVADSDGDGVNDGDEIAAGTDPLSPADDPVDLHQIWVEAEDGDIYTPMQIMTDTGASLAGCVCVPNGAQSTDGEVVYQFDIEQAGNYLIWGRVLAPSGNDDSFYVSVDGESQFRWNTQQGTDWTWDEVAEHQGDDPRIYYFQPGQHTLRFVQREDGTHLDKILITNDLSYVPEGKGGGEGSEPAPGNMTHVVIEAESAALTAPMAVYQDAAAASGAYIEVPQGSGSFLDAPSEDAGLATYEFYVSESGNYRVWGRVLAVSGSDDSFYAAMDDGAYERWNTQQATSWTWDLVASHRVADPRIYALDAGYHTFYLLQREDGTRIDKIVITKDAQYVPQGLGEPASDVPDETVPDAHVVLEAETAVINSPMSVQNDASASSGAYIKVPQGLGSYLDAPVTDAGLAAYEFTVNEGGDYRVWGRVLAPSGSDDSFYVAMDQGTYERWNTQQSNSWTWDLVAVHRGSDPQIYTLDAGRHTLYILQREDGTAIDKIVITKDAQYEPQGVGEPANQTPEVSIPVSHVELEAEAAVVDAPMEIQNDVAASSGAYVGVPQGAGSFLDAPVTDAGLAAYEFTITESGDYRVWGRVLAPSASDDSFYAAMDDGAFERWNTQQSTSWTWDLVASHRVADPRIYSLDAGDHTFYLLQREDGTSIDKLIITKNSEFVPE